MADNVQDRRKFLASLSLTFGAGILSSSFIIPKSLEETEECKTTPILDMGPFAVMQYRNQSDHDIDLTQIKGQNGIAKGQHIIIFGKVTDKDCKPIKSAIVEIWSANHFGRYRHEFDNKGEIDPNFQGWGQAITNNEGEFRFKTVYPGLYGKRARHIHFKISRRDYHELITQLFFEGGERNDTDFILNYLTHEEQMQVIKKLIDKDQQKQIEFNITLDKIKQGEISEKAVKEYTGKYTLHNATYNFETLAKNLTGNTYKEIVIELTHKKSLLFMQTPFSPKIEILWNAKDEYQSWAFNNTFIRFVRDEKGKVSGLKLHFSEEQYAEGTKKKNNR
jgi:protocatechuate 3,4-dioxygenase beta subunit